MKKKFHLIGIGGIGMSALARILVQRGHEVQGSDAKMSPLLEDLQKEGVLIRLGHTQEGLEGCTVVYSSAVKEDNVELQMAKTLSLPIWHRSDLLDDLMRFQKPLLVTGTHGKTTTTALLASVLMEAKMDPSFVVGGIVQSLKTNGKSGSGAYFVAEADESDGSFLKTKQIFGAIVTNCENDHLDYWKDAASLDQAFATFFSQVQNPKHLFWCFDDSRLSALNPRGISYGFSKDADLVISGYRVSEKGIFFDLSWNNQKYVDIHLSLFGEHNALNGAAVFGLSLSLGIEETAIRKAFQTFRGTKRRLEFRGEKEGVTVYDDYAHHPTEIKVTLKGLRALKNSLPKTSEGRLIVVFQPHRFTRVRDLWSEFPLVFEDADMVILTDIYAASEAPIPGISSESFHAAMQNSLQNRLQFIPRFSLEEKVASLLRPQDIVVTMGAGDIVKAADMILNLYQGRA